MIVLAVLAVACIAGVVVFAMLSARTEALAGQVQAVRWERSIVVEAIGPVEHQDWKTAIPVDGVILSCREREHHVQDTPAEGAERVCGEPYTVDKGSGYGEVVQDCQYHVYADYCDYTVEEWRQVDVIQAQGRDLQAFWPEKQLAPQSRLGRQKEQYTIVFTTPQGDYTYTTSDYSLYQRAVPGANWSLDINALGNLVNAEPLR
jgi:hypothetical protein